MSTRNDIITALYDALNGDPEILAAAGGTFPIYHRLAKRGVSMPYGVHLLKLSPSEDNWFITDGKYLFDIWDYYPNSDRAGEVGDLIMEKLQHAYFDIPSAPGFRLRVLNDPDLYSDDENIWRNCITFRIRFFAKETADAVRARSLDG